VNDEARKSAWVEGWARHIEARGLSSLALLLIEIARPLGLLGSQALLMAQPLLADIVDDMTVERTTTLICSPELLDRLKVFLERKEG